jgi:hypothetical protein
MRTAPAPDPHASVSRENSLVKSGNDKTGAMHKAVFRAENELLWSLVHTNKEFFLRRSVGGLLIIPKFLTNFL